MKAYETVATVEAKGQLSVAGVPFAPGTEVEVMVNPKRGSAEAFAAAWDRVCHEMRERTAELTEDEIQQEIDVYRAAR